MQKENRTKRKKLEKSSHMAAQLSDDVLFQPWFLSKLASKAILRLIPPDYIARMRWYFDDYGCIYCKRTKKKVLYQANGFCIECGTMIRRRLVQTVRRRGKKLPLQTSRSASSYFDRVQAAEDLLADSVPNKPRLIASLPRMEVTRKRGKSFWRI